MPPDPPTLGADFDTDWARSPAARAARGVIANGPLRLVVHGLAAPEIYGVDRLDDLRRRADDATSRRRVIFAPNHHSHLDTALMISAVPCRGAERSWSPRPPTSSSTRAGRRPHRRSSLNAIPIDREVDRPQDQRPVNRA